jgi:hypothetical protein
MFKRLPVLAFRAKWGLAAAAGKTLENLGRDLWENQKAIYDLGNEQDQCRVNYDRRLDRYPENRPKIWKYPNW